jgi:hypothetical protein
LLTFGSVIIRSREPGEQGENIGLRSSRAPKMLGNGQALR